MTTQQLVNDSDIAIIGLSCRAPGAATLDAFWHNIREGIESVSFFSHEQLRAAGIAPATLEHPDYVNAGAILSDVELFDASFFDFSPRQAQLTDPQHRLFLECAWESLENAGYALQNNQHIIGVYAGTSMSSYLINHLYPDKDSLTDAYTILIGNDKDFLTTRVSYKLNLTGPSITVQTACSTSLVAIHLACQSLLNGECDMSLAGGVSIACPQTAGYLYQKGSIQSPDGHCRAFDAKAKGTVGGSGVGILVLKRLEQALADGDTIHGVIKGSAVNNDGFSKVGYTAPGVEGQAAVISEARAVADIDPETIGYIEAHGTGTPLGDPIEMAALTRAFQGITPKKGFCAVGSLKTNIGHTDAAAGVLGVIKTILALEHGQLPPSLHFKHPNPQIDFTNSPFYVNTKLSEWKTNDTPRRAGVSSFGIGGTNAHVILEQAPDPTRYLSSKSPRPCQLLIISAKTPMALDKATENLADHFRENPCISLADTAYTLHCGRKEFKYRRMLVCRDLKETCRALGTLNPKQVFTDSLSVENRPLVFMFPGQGSQYVQMGRALYRTEPIFRNEVDTCSDYLLPILNLDLRDILYPDREQTAGEENRIDQTAITQTALFVTEYALAKLWMSHGVHPRAMVGHSIGEYVAACLARVFSLTDALSLVAARGQMMQSLPKGAMLAVLLPESKLCSLVPETLCLAAVNTPDTCVVSGPPLSMETFRNQLSGQEIKSRWLKTSHGFHSRMMDPILTDFTDRVRQVRLNPPQIAYISNVTGTWITAAQATDPEYWARHLRQTVRFSDGIQTIFDDSATLLLEMGPGRTLANFARATLAKQHSDKQGDHRVLSCLGPPTDPQAEPAFLLNTLGRIWLAGGSVDWEQFYAAESRHRLPLPTYPFERQRYWIDPPDSLPRADAPAAPSQPKEPGPCQRPAWKKPFVAPRNNLEQTIADIWSRALGIEQISIHDLFFELGGDSLLAVQVISRLTARLNIQLNPHSLLNNNTILALANFIERLDPAASDLALHPALPPSLVPIQTGDPKISPLFLMHPVGGHVYFYREMAKALGAKQPVYGLEAQGADGTQSPLTRVEEMAAQYINALQNVQPQGPYFLGGSSFGGTLAFEMAQQLRAAGQKVAFLAMMDTPGPGHMPVELKDDAQIFAYLLNLGHQILVSESFLRTLTLDEQLDYCIGQIKKIQKDLPDIDPTQFRIVLNLFKTNSRAMADYIPKPYAGKIFFFRAKERDAYLPHNPELAWIDLAREGTQVHVVAGNHISMNELPLVLDLAKQLTRCMNQARADAAAI
jgi:acyl transferase domain-containing protein/thioesterase domain-containing protein